MTQMCAVTPYDGAILSWFGELLQRLKIVGLFGVEVQTNGPIQKTTCHYALLPYDGLSQFHSHPILSHPLSSPSDRVQRSFALPLIKSSPYPQYLFTRWSLIIL